MNVVIKDNSTVLVTEDDVKLVSLLSNGATRPQTAQKLRIKENAMDMRLRRLRLKMGLQTNYQLIAYFVRQKWV